MTGWPGVSHQTVPSVAPAELVIRIVLLYEPSNEVTGAAGTVPPCMTPIGPAQPIIIKHGIIAAQSLSGDISAIP
jgi:hypothetical protein